MKYQTKKLAPNRSTRKVENTVRNPINTKMEGNISETYNKFISSNPQVSIQGIPLTMVEILMVNHWFEENCSIEWPMYAVIDL